MMKEQESKKQQIINTLKEKAVLKQIVYEKTQNCLKELKKAL